MTQILQFRIRILAPVHIGCGEVYEPTAFTLGKTGKLNVFNPMDFIRSLDEAGKQTFTGICRKGTVESILEVLNFVRNHGQDLPGRAVDICYGLKTHINQTLSIKPDDKVKIRNELNRFAIERTAFDPNTAKPYLPGTSIKGSFRTAYLNALGLPQSNNPKLLKIPAKKGKELENELLANDKIETDPFRMVKVSDFIPVGAVKTRIIYAVNRRKNPGGGPGKGPEQILEVIEPGAIFEGQITINQPERNARILKPVTFDALRTSARTFYGNRMAVENSERANMEIKPFSPKLTDSTILFRIGRHSGAESLTLEGFRQISIMGEKGQVSIGKEATTLWLAADMKDPAPGVSMNPFGWAVLEPAGQGAEPADEIVSSDAIATEKWENVHLSFNPGSQMITAVCGDRKAFVKGKELAPEAYQNQLFGKKKSVSGAGIEVVKNGNQFVIHSILNPRRD